KSKYVHALHDSLNLFPIRFAQVPGLQRVTVDAGGGEHTRKDFQKILDVIAQRDKQVKEVEKLYLEGRITIGTFSNLIGKNVIDIWGSLAGDLRRGIKYCIGTAFERDQALRLIKDNRRIAVDITALLTCRGIEILDLLKKVFPEILISQSTIDLLREGISERRGLASKGFMTVWK